MLFAQDAEVSLAATAALVNTGRGDAEGLPDEAALDRFITEWRWTGQRTRNRAELDAVRQLRPRLARLWEAVGEFGVGFCLDTCHAFAGGEDLAGVVDKVMGITGRIDLVHANNSRDDFDSGADRHANFDSGTIDPELIADVCRAAGSDVLVETPAEGQKADIAYLRGQLA